jgi:RNA polymerase sigma factor (sigma-70 family)
MQDQLIDRLKLQDRAALEALYDAYSGALFGVVLRIVQSRELAEQVLQDTFVKVWRNAASYDASKGRVFTWLLNIARNTAIDATRTAHFQHYRKTDSLDTLVYSSGGASVNPDHIGLRELVQRLDVKYRELIEMVYFKGYTQEEVAQETGIPLGTIKTRLRHAIGELRRVFGNAVSNVLLVLGTAAGWFS